MFSWLKSLFSGDDSNDIYTIKERRIYYYWDGSKKISADPLVLYKKMMNVGPELSIDMKVATSIHKDARKAHDSLIQKIRGIFDVKPFEEGGLTQGETIALLNHFLTFTNRVKKKSNSSVTSAKETSDTTNSLHEESQPTPPPLDSGSTKDEPSTDSPPSLPTVQA